MNNVGLRFANLELYRVFLTGFVFWQNCRLENLFSINLRTNNNVSYRCVFRKPVFRINFQVHKRCLSFSFPMVS